jgi:vacuolar-type H+-ATPase subunit D/Vma8
MKEISMNNKYLKLCEMKRSEMANRRMKLFRENEEMNEEI